MSNPYASPVQPGFLPPPQNEVNAPAIGLMVCSIIGLVLGLFGFLSDAVMLALGVFEGLESHNQGPFSEYTQLAVRTVWGIVLFFAAAFVLYGALQMKSMKNYGVAKSAAVVAVIPCVGPCCLLGIPFGIWALVVLSKPHVQASFR